MRMRVEGLADETTAMIARISRDFGIKSVSGFKPNYRNSATISDGRVYIELDGFKQDMLELMIVDMLALLETLGDGDNIDKDAETAKIREFYDVARKGMDYAHIYELHAAWRNGLIRRVLGK